MWGEVTLDMTLHPFVSQEDLANKVPLWLLSEEVWEIYLDSSCDLLVDLTPLYKTADM